MLCKDYVVLITRFHNANLNNYTQIKFMLALRINHTRAKIEI